MIEFKFCGDYRVQSRRSGVYSELAGEWCRPQSGLLTSAEVKALLRKSALWTGTATVSLRASRVLHRSRGFAKEGDALYYRQHFNPVEDVEPMETDILDLEKLADHWEVRQRTNEQLFGDETFAALITLVDDVRTTANNEYFCHEAGHAMGWDIGSKDATGYFRVGNRAAWPLIFVEEFRADMLALGFALEALPRDKAAAKFAYHLLHRFGLAGYSMRHNVSGAGAGPYLLFCLLCDLNFFVPGDRVAGLAISPENLELDRLTAIMRACADHAASHLTLIEIDNAHPIDVAINAAG